MMETQDQGIFKFRATNETLRIKDTKRQRGPKRKEKREWKTLKEKERKKERRDLQAHV